MNQMPTKYRFETLDTCDLISKDLVAFGREWAKNPVPLFVYGKNGRGKTQFSFCLIREMLRKRNDIWPRYFTSTDMDVSLLEASQAPKGDKEEIKKYAEQDLLFIDDFGRENKSDRLKRQYFQIINYRYSNNLPTILTSNFTIDELSRSLDEAIASRLQEWELIEMQGPDLRLMPESKRYAKIESAKFL